MSRILVTGSRDWDDHVTIRDALDDNYIPGATLVSGACIEGADRIAEQHAEKSGWNIERHPADWGKNGKKAGFVRSAEMVDAGAEVCLAFIKDGSPGATMTKNLAKKSGIPTRVFRVDGGFRNSIDLHPHQEKALETLDNGKILCGGVGSGKSLTAAVYYRRNEAPRDVYVITTAKKRDSLDWEKEFVKYGVGTSRNATVGGVLAVDSWNNIGKYQDVEDSFFIFDEQRLVGSGEWTKAFLRIAKKNRWILLSATPGDTWLDYIPVFVANGFYKNRTAFKREHVVYNTFSKFPKVDRYVSVGKLIRFRRQLLVRMPFERETTRHSLNIEVEYDKDLLEEVLVKRWHVYENRPIRDAAELIAVMRKVVNSDPSRLEAIRELMKKHDRLIVFYNFNYELEALRTLSEEGEGSWRTADIESSQGESSRKTTLSPPRSIVSNVKRPSQKPFSKITNTTSTTTSTTGYRSPLVVAEWNGHKHQEVPTSDRWLYLVQYTAGAEAWECTTTNATAFYSPTYSYKAWEQSHGRIDRMNTPFKDLYYYRLISSSAIEQAIYKSIRSKKNFNERDYIDTI